MLDCAECKRYEKLEAQLKAAATTELWPWKDVLSGLSTLLSHEQRKHATDQHTIRCVTGADGND